MTHETSNRPRAIAKGRRQGLTTAAKAPQAYESRQARYGTGKLIPGTFGLDIEYQSPRPLPSQSDIFASWLSRMTHAAQIEDAVCQTSPVFIQGTNLYDFPGFWLHCGQKMVHARSYSTSRTIYNVYRCTACGRVHEA